MRIACFQGPNAANAPNENVVLLERMAISAIVGGAQLLICPEMFLTGYNLGPHTVARLAEPANGASVTAARAIARNHGIALAFGYPERDERGRIFNSVVFIDSGGDVLSHYRKTHLFGDIDRTAFSAGEVEPQVFSWNGLKVGLLICYDVEFPETVRILAQNAADLVVVPTALMRPFDIIARVIVPARAYENQVFVAYVDRCGSEGGLDYCGLSCVVAPDGSDLARAGPGEELIFADIDPQRLLKWRKTNTHLQDRRPGLYGALAAGTKNHESP